MARTSAGTPKLVAGESEQPSLGNDAEGVPGAADPLQQRGDRAGRPQLADEVDVADVDAELERSRRHHDPQVPELEPLFRSLPTRMGQAAVMRGHLVLAESFGQLAGNPFGMPASIYEHERTAMVADEPPPDVHRFRPLFVKRIPAASGDLDGQVQRADMTRVHDCGGSIAPRTCGKRLPTGLSCRRPMRCGRRTERRAVPATEPNGCRACRMPLDLIHNHSFDLASAPPTLGGEDQVAIPASSPEYAAAAYPLPVLCRRIAVRTRARLQTRPASQADRAAPASVCKLR